jgi:hypothetical protein
MRSSFRLSPRPEPAGKSLFVLRLPGNVGHAFKTGFHRGFMA